MERPPPLRARVARPPPIRTDGTNAFARYSMQVRVPRIARDVLVRNPDYPPAIADAVDLPLVLYNIPGRSVVEISVETMTRLSKVANIVGVKDATGNIARSSRDRAA